MTFIDAAFTTNLETEGLVQPPYRLTMYLELPQGEAPTGQKPRQVLALLMANAGKMVLPAVLSEELWGDRPPKTGPATVQTYIYKIRDALGDTSRPDHEKIIRTVPGGYCFATKPSTVDALAFIESVKVQVPRAGDDERQLRRVLERLEASMALLRGPLLTDVKRGAVLQRFIEGFNEYHKMALLRRIKVCIMLGEYDEVLPELVMLSAAHPCDESYAMWQMLALYRAGRQAEALEIFRKLRSNVIQELGLDLSPRVQALRDMILRHDTRLLQDASYMP
jgi:SARP family transcriptional regulator, regulator of embCAB operon